MEEAIIALLLANDGVIQIVANRLTPGVRPQRGVLPCLVFNKIDGGQDVTHAGANGQTDSRVQIDSYAATYAEAKAAARAVRLALNGYRGTVTVKGGAIPLQGVFLDSDRDLFEGEDPDKVFRVSQDFKVWAEEA